MSLQIPDNDSPTNAPSHLPASTIDRSNLRYRTFKRQQDEQSFTQLCYALRQNDEHLTSVDFSQIRVEGYGPSLGAALRDNTHVSQLSLQLDPFYTSSDEGNNNERSLAEDVLHFFHTSPTLRHVELSCEISPERFHLHAGWILDALTTNSASTTGTGTGNGTDTTLHTVVLKNFPLHWDWEPLTRLLTTSLETLYVHCELDRNLLATTGCAHAIGQAFASNQSLRHLTMHLDGDFLLEDESFLGPILENLHTHPTLTELVLDFRYKATELHIESLSLYLQHATVLSRLTLNLVAFDKDKMRHLLQGLSTSYSLTALSFFMCRCDAEATRLFVEYMQTASTNPSPRIRSLQIVEGTSRNQMFAPALARFGQAATVTLPLTLMDMLTAPDSNGQNEERTTTTSSVGMQLESLSVNGIGLGPRRPTRSANATDVALGWKSFFRHGIPPLMHLKTLVIEGVHCQILETETGIICRSLRKNGSLIAVQFRDGNEDNGTGSSSYYDDDEGNLSRDLLPPDTFFSPRQTLFVAAYCERNRRLLSLLLAANHSTPDNNSRFTVETKEQGVMIAPLNTLNPKRSRLGVSLHPCLYVAAQQVPRTAPSFILRSLLITSYVGSTVDSRFR